ncbi:MAG: gliding motility-associated C-terminal domain-containing protein [Bacteroidetes bacterium]|nr:gliding motility-associated C-terminal domain-containing protein [Bacteroidota bacterium]
MNQVQKLIAFLLLLPFGILAQDIELLQQFEGRYSYLAFGNTLNIDENTGGTAGCDILLESDATFSLDSDQQLIAAYLYWAGSGTGDFEVRLNDIDITAERTFLFEMDSIHSYAGGFANITDQLLTTGNGSYTFSEFTPEITDGVYCGIGGNTTNFGGWAVTVVYEDATLPLNQVSLFDGFVAVSISNNSLDIQLTDLDVVDNAEAQIGFLAWEGDQILANNETLRLNTTILSNPLNPATNAFNGTNTFTGSTSLYNMDIDVYSIAGLIQPGDETALIQLTSNQDLVIVNNIATVLNIALPDATISMDSILGGTKCDNREITIDYTVFNTNGTDRFPIASIGFYADNTLIEQTTTAAIIDFGASETGSITLTIPDSVPADFLLRAIVDDTSDFNELDEENNESTVDFHLLVSPEVSGLTNLQLCDVFGLELFDLTDATNTIDPINAITYHTSEIDAENNENPITENIESYENTTNPETIWIRVANPDCFVVESFTIEIIECPLPDATVSIDNELYACRQRDLLIEFTVYNIEGTAPLPAGTPIAFYADLQLLGTTLTLNTLPIGTSETSSIEVSLVGVPTTFVLAAVADENGAGIGIVEELNEQNNEFDIAEEFGTIPPITDLPDLVECDRGFEMATFALTNQDDLITQNTPGELNYFISEGDALANINPIENPGDFVNTSNPQTIFVRLENEICFRTTSFTIMTERCAPIIYDGISPNGDMSNDVFHIDYLIDVFPKFELKIYSREGNLIYEGGNDDGLWDAIPNTGVLYTNTFVPVGTYYYVLVLNDSDFPSPFIGDVYVNY